MVDLGSMGWRLGLPMCKVKSDRHGSKGQWVRAGAGGVFVWLLGFGFLDWHTCLLPVVYNIWIQLDILQFHTRISSWCNSLPVL